MSDDFKPLDPGRVATTNPVEVKYWCHEFGCTETQLKTAVELAGEHVAAIRAALAASHRPGRP